MSIEEKEEKHVRHIDQIELGLQNADMQMRRVIELRACHLSMTSNMGTYQQKSRAYRHKREVVNLR